jgi:prolyl-tRNA synthetase
MEEEKLTDWYHKVLDEAGIIDMRYPIKGMLIYRKWGLFVIREMQRFLEDELEKHGHEPCLFPVLIPDNILGKETEHIAGFEEEVFWVTHAGKNLLERKLALRPTSETPMYEMFSLWIRSHTDLPFKVHQSCAVYRYETKHTRPLIRGREFLWNEGHSAHALAQDAAKNVEEIKKIYANLINRMLCLPFAIDKRPEWDKFPGATETYAFDTLLPDGKTLQIATVHNLGQNFSKVFNIQYETADQGKEYVYQCSYGPSFGRLLAALICVHGDEKGLILPPFVAPVQAVIIPILFKKTESENKGILDYAHEVEAKLKELGIRTAMDLGDQHPGEKYYKWEMRGVPLRIEVGPRDLKDRKMVAARRDVKEKREISFNDIGKIKGLFAEIEDAMRKKAEEKFAAGLLTAKNFPELEKQLGVGMVSCGWCGGKDCAAKIEDKCSVLSIEDGEAACVVCGKIGRKIKTSKTY